MYVTDADGSWEEHVLVHTETGTENSGPILVDSTGKVHIAYQLAPSNEIWYGSFTPLVTTVPGPPTGLSAMVVDGEVHLSWVPPEDDGGRNITSYIVYRGVDGASMIALASIEDTSYIDADPAGGLGYLYQVSAVNPEGEGARSAIVSTSPSEEPPPPTDLSAVYDNGTVYLQWKAPPSNGACPVTGYRIYRGTASTPMVYLATVNGTVYQDLGLSGGTYQYAVTAMNGAGESTMSGTVNVTVPAPSPPSSIDATLLLSGLAITGCIGLVAALWWRKGRSNS